MRKLFLAMVLTLGIPGLAMASPVTFATYLDLGVGGAAPLIRSQFFSPVDSATNANAFGGSGQNTFGTSMVAFGEANLAQAALRISNRGSGVVGQGVSASALFMDTITYDGSAFEGVFGASHDLLLTATFHGVFNSSNIFGLGTATIESGGTGGRIHVYDGSVQVDEDVFDNSNTLVNFMFLNGPAPLCAQGVNGPDLSTFGDGEFTVTVSCQVQMSAQRPSIHVLMNMPSFINATSASWDLNMLNTGSLTADFGGRTVYSASGAFPGTIPETTAVPEPATLSLVGIGLAAAARKIRRRPRG